ncbi:rubrerythrin family protein [Sebaldella sp. S0638]|nr:rubrerythrin family protein [Sebaldella sp. S0638]
MMKLKGTKTAENLLKAFAGESQANRRYTYYAKVARKQGYVQIADIFEETADQESMHAKRFFSFLNEDKELQGEMLGITAEYPVALFEETLENLKAAAAGENEEWTDLYPEFAKVAREEGFGAIAAAFDKISEVEARHEKRYRKLIENIETNTVFQKSEVVEWKCTKCGYVHTGDKAPVKCPACLHDQGYFELNNTNY